MEPCVSVNMRPYDVKIQGGTASLYTYPLGVVVPPPKDYVLWSMFNFSFMNVCCLGFAALVYSIKTRDAKVIGDREIGVLNSKKAKRCNIAATVLGILVFILICVMIGLVVAAYQDKLLQMMEDFWVQLETTFSGNAI
uniref:Interferon-induced transmembrane protein 3 n=1 Tax=Salvator merianae TaxID=96440 RepID=A0A8D0C592_SALMN